MTIAPLTARSRSKVRRYLPASAALVGGLLVGYLTGHVVGSVDLQGGGAFWTWVDGWLHSPGFAGTAAVLAAGVAYLAARINASAQREGVAAQRENSERQDDAARVDRWWDQMKWAIEQIDGDSESQYLGIEALQQFAETAPGDDELNLALRILSRLGVQEPATDPSVDDEDEDPAE
ncbi:hypothetical protein V6N00_13155 [Tersicoccus sp. MR15.9]|uniref:hypothetical protein n=1 Tax=Tersicoccus mangrovi TaxID=3121635 RepID=UPI002FE58C30